VRDGGEPTRPRPAWREREREREREDQQQPKGGRTPTGREEQISQGRGGRRWRPAGASTGTRAAATTSGWISASA